MKIPSTPRVEGAFEETGYVSYGPVDRSVKGFWFGSAESALCASSDCLGVIRRSPRLWVWAYICVPRFRPSSRA
jgi:hypothetical protein